MVEMDERNSYPRCDEYWLLFRLADAEANMPEDSNDEITYVINYHARSLENYQQYLEKEAPRLQNEHNKKFKNKFQASRSVYSLITK